MGLKAKATYCQRHLTGEDAEESKKQGENKGAKYVSLASLAP
jgi:hypothetical protein